MATVSDRLQFLHGWRTDVWLAEKSGIPRSTLGVVRRGERELPSQYTAAFRQSYQSAMYDILRKEGYPRKASFQFSYLDPENWRPLQTELRELRQGLAIGWTAGALERAQREGRTVDFWEEYNKAYEKASIAIAESDYSWDETQDRYPARSQSFI